MNNSQIINDLDTPVVLIDLNVLDNNLQHSANLAQKAGVKLRPHFKTHKSVWIANKQLKLGASGITVAKLGEAEILVDAGVKDILIAFPIVGAAKLKRLAKLMERASITVSIDNAIVAQGLSELGQSLNQRIPLYIDVNTGLNRCGKQPGEETAVLVQEIAVMPGVEVRGLMTHGGHAYGKASLEALRQTAAEEVDGLVQSKLLLEKMGIPIPEISVGSTPTSKYIGEQATAGATETRPGAYVYGDGVQLSIGIINEQELAMSVLTTVVSTPREGTIIIDAGSKTFSSDANPHKPGYGFLISNPDVYIERLSEEHGIVRTPADISFAIGDRLRFIPNHCCTVSNLHNQLQGIRGDRVEHVITVDARGQIK